MDATAIHSALVRSNWDMKKCSGMVEMILGYINSETTARGLIFYSHKHVRGSKEVPCGAPFLDRATQVYKDMKIWVWTRSDEDNIMVSSFNNMAMKFDHVASESLENFGNLSLYSITQSKESRKRTKYEAMTLLTSINGTISTVHTLKGYHPYKSCDLTSEETCFKAPPSAYLVLEDNSILPFAIEESVLVRLFGIHLSDIDTKIIPQVKKNALGQLTAKPSQLKGTTTLSPTQHIAAHQSLQVSLHQLQHSREPDTPANDSVPTHAFHKSDSDTQMWDSDEPLSSSPLSSSTLSSSFESPVFEMEETETQKLINDQFLQALWSTDFSSGNGVPLSVPVPTSGIHRMEVSSRNDFLSNPKEDPFAMGRMESFYINHQRLM